MNIGKPKLILNPYDWLPGYGESRVSFNSVGLDVTLNVEYENAVIIDNKEVDLPLRREIKFISVRYFLREPFPGSTIFDFYGCPDEFRLGELTEFEDSELIKNDLKSWHSVSTHKPPICRHFAIQFLSANIAFHVLAEDVFLSNELSAS